MRKSEGYLNYIHYFRGFAILVIVGIHCRIAMGWVEDDPGQQLFTTALDNGTILFVFIAGFLFHYLKNKYQYKTYLIRKAQYVIIPYLLISAIPILLKSFNIMESDWIPDEMLPDNSIGRIIFYVATGKHLGPFWFIPMITIFYFISPLLIRLDNSFFYRYFFPPMIIASLFTFKFGFFTNIWVSFLHFLPVYMYGMWASNNRQKIVSMSRIAILALIVIYLCLSAFELTGLIEVPKISSFTDDKNMPLFAFNIVKLRQYILCLILLRLFYSLNGKNLPLLAKLGDYSFGIYFIHIFLIIIIEKGIHWLIPGFHLNSITFLIYVIVVTLFSVIGVHAVKKITGKYSRMIIGS